MSETRLDLHTAGIGFKTNNKKPGEKVIAVIIHVRFCLVGVRMIM